MGPYLWHEFDAASVTRDLAAIAARRIPVVRTMLSWDAFMPTDRAASAHRLRDLETLLAAARERRLTVVLSLFAHSIGDCVLLPRYAVDRRAPRRGVRCVTDGRVVDGGPRDMYADPLMLEVQVRLLDILLAAFAGHPAVAAWELGHDPASTIRPRRIAQMAAWAALLAGRIRDKAEISRITVGQDDVVHGRGVRLAALGEHVDALGIVVRPQRLPLPGGALDPGRPVFLVELAQALAGASAPLAAEIGLASGDLRDASASDIGATDMVTAPSRDVARHSGEMLQRLVETGVSGLHAAAWSDWGDRLADTPPSDRHPWWSRQGIVDRAGVSKPVAEPWEEIAGRERAICAQTPYPAAIDVESYYANLPESLRELHASWQGDRSDTPAILG